MYNFQHNTVILLQPPILSQTLFFVYFHNDLAIILVLSLLKHSFLYPFQNNIPSTLESHLPTKTLFLLPLHYNMVIIIIQSPLLTKSYNFVCSFQYNIAIILPHLYLPNHLFLSYFKHTIPFSITSQWHYCHAYSPKHFFVSLVPLHRNYCAITFTHANILLYSFQRNIEIELVTFTPTKHSLLYYFNHNIAFSHIYSSKISFCISFNITSQLYCSHPKFFCTPFTVISQLYYSLFC